jgi:hypothetical protein
LADEQLRKEVIMKRMRSSQLRVVVTASLIALAAIGWSNVTRADAVLDWHDVAVNTIVAPGTQVDGAETTTTSQYLSEEPDQVLAWNVTALRVIQPAHGIFPFRWLAILHGSIFDAVNGVTGDYEPFIVNQTAPAGSTENAAAAGAGYYTLTHLPYDPPLTAAQQQIITDHYNSLPASITGNPGFAFGQNVAAQVFANRPDDGAPTVGFSIYHAPCEGQPGCWVPQLTPTGPAPALVPTWGNQRTWVLNDVTQFYAEAPPALDSEQYLRDLAEVESLGYKFSTTRTLTQTNIAVFWQVGLFHIYQPIARRMSEAHGLSISENARLFAVLNVGAADTYINTWHTKYNYNFWRPITAIQYTGNTGWVPLLPTPPFPEYTSGHCSGTGAYTQVLIEFFGDNPGIPIFVTSPAATPTPGFTRTWATFSEGQDECIDARVFVGFHFRNSDVFAARFGGTISNYIVKHSMRTNPGHSPARGAQGNAPADPALDAQDPDPFID